MAFEAHLVAAQRFERAHPALVPEMWAVSVWAHSALPAHPALSARGMLAASARVKQAWVQSVREYLAPAEPGVPGFVVARKQAGLEQSDVQSGVPARREVVLVRQEVLGIPAEAHKPQVVAPEAERLAAADWQFVQCPDVVHFAAVAECPVEQQPVADS